MTTPIGIEVLIKEREKLIAEKNRVNETLDNQIADIESSIELLSGKKVWEVSTETTYDDSNPDYIKGSIED